MFTSIDTTDQTAGLQASRVESCPRERGLATWVVRWVRLAGRRTRVLAIERLSIIAKPCLGREKCTAANARPPAEMRPGRSHRSQMIAKSVCATVCEAAAAYSCARSVSQTMSLFFAFGRRVERTCFRVIENFICGSLFPRATTHPPVTRVACARDRARYVGLGERSMDQLSKTR